MFIDIYLKSGAVLELSHVDEMKTTYNHEVAAFTAWNLTFRDDLPKTKSKIMTMAPEQIAAVVTRYQSGDK